MRRLAAVAALAFLAAGFAWAMRYDPADEARALPTPSVSPEARGARVVVRDKGQPRVDLQARTARMTPDQSQATLEDVQRAVVFKDGKEYLRVRAARIVFDRRTQNFVAMGGVEVTSPKGDWLRAPQMAYDDAAGVLTFSQGVEFRVGGHRARARSLRYRVQDETVELEGEVDVQFDQRSVPRSGPGGRAR